MLLLAVPLIFVLTDHCLWTCHSYLGEVAIRFGDVRLAISKRQMKIEMKWEEDCVGGAGENVRRELTEYPHEWQSHIHQRPIHCPAHCIIDCYSVSCSLPYSSALFPIHCRIHCLPSRHSLLSSLPSSLPFDSSSQSVEILRRTLALSISDPPPRPYDPLFASTES
jgi:hypothetical protein